MITDNMAEAAIKTVSETLCTQVVARDIIDRQFELQKSAFQDNGIYGVLTREQEEDRKNGREFQFDRKHAKEMGEEMFRMGITTRLRGAYANYKAGNELDCIRHLLIAMSVVCEVMNWKKAANYLNEQNIILLDRIKTERNEQNIILLDQVKMKR